VDERTNVLRLNTRVLEKMIDSGIGSYHSVENAWVAIGIKLDQYLGLTQGMTCCPSSLKNQSQNLMNLTPDPLP
jgi:hypothetical protein